MLGFVLNKHRKGVVWYLVKNQNPGRGAKRGNNGTFIYNKRVAGNNEQLHPKLKCTGRKQQMNTHNSLTGQQTTRILYSVITLHTTFFMQVLQVMFDAVYPTMGDLKLVDSRRFTFDL